MNAPASQRSQKQPVQEHHQHYALIAKAIEWIRNNQLEQPSLSDLAFTLSISEFHLQRLFSEWAGISPKQFLQVLTKEHAKKILVDQPVLETALESGLSNSSRLHDLFVTYEAMSPGEYKKGGQGITISYGSALCPFGLAFIAQTHRGVCKLSFFDHPSEYDALLEELKREWPNAQFSEQQKEIAHLAELIFASQAQPNRSLKLLLKGSPFRVKVWEALLSIPEGKLVTYKDIAEQIGQPSASRAAATAIANNSIGYLIPCHRVIRNTGEFNQYRWGATRKAALIAKELC